MKKFILLSILILGFFFAQSQYLYTPDESTPLPYDVPANVYVFNYGLEKWCLTSTAITSGTNLTTAITLGYAHYVDTGGGTPAPSSSVGNYINFTGVEGATAQQNADSLALAFTRGDEVFIQKGVYNMASYVIPEGKTLRFEQGAMFNVTGTLTGSYTGVNAGMYQVFNLDADLQGYWKGNNGEAFVEWFGAKGDGTGDNDMPAFQKALEVFCKPDTTSFYSQESTLIASGHVVKALGNKYVVKETLIFPAYGDLEIGKRTIMKLDTNNFFESAVKIKYASYKFEGGTWIVPRYESQAGYAGSAQDDAAKIQYAYNKHPVFDVGIISYNHTNGNTMNYDRSKNSIRDLEITQTFEYDRTSALTQYLRYNAFHIGPDTTSYTSGTLEWRRLYKIQNYVAGDDFSTTKEGDAVAVLSGTMNTSGCVFVIGAPADYTPGAQLTPAVWSNGSEIRNRSNAEYFNIMQDVAIRNADTAIYMYDDADGSSEAFTMGADGILFDKCQTAIVIEDRSWTNSFTNCFFQAITETTPGSAAPIIDLYGNINYITGFLMDPWHDSSIMIRESSTANIINLAVQNNVLLEDYTTFKNQKDIYSNTIGPHNMWHKSNDNSSGATSHYWFRGKAAGFIDPDNTTIVDKDTDPQAVLYSVAASQGTAPPAAIFEGYANAGGQLNNLTAFDNTLSLTTRFGGAQTNPRKGIGPSINFYMADSIDQEAKHNGTYDDFPLGRIGFRNGVEGGASDIIEGAFQIWNQEGLSGSVTASNANFTLLVDGKLGLNKVVNPQAEIDLVGGTDNQGGVANTDARIITNIGNFHPYGTLPTAGMKQGDMVFVATSATDGDMYIYTGSAWKAITRDP